MLALNVATFVPAAMIAVPCTVKVPVPISDAQAVCAAAASKDLDVPVTVAGEKAIAAPVESSPSTAIV